MYYENLNDKELLTMVIKENNRGVVDDLFEEFNNLSGILFHATPEELVQIRGIGHKKAQQILALKEVLKRLNTYSWTNNKYKIKSPQDIANLLGEMKHLRQEEFKTILLDAKNQVLKIETISKGTLNASLVHPREVFAEAIKKRSAAIALVHNHPSGNPEPSKEDINITKRLAEAGKIIGIEVIDHVIIGDWYYSFRENSLI